MEKVVKGKSSGGREDIGREETVRNGQISKQGAEEESGRRVTGEEDFRDGVSASPGYGWGIGKDDKNKCGGGQNPAAPHG